MTSAKPPKQLQANLFADQHGLNEFTLTTSEGVDPLLKWPGGKRRLLKELLPIVFPISGRYFEPFLGGGALFFRLQPVDATLSDSNEELINCYVHVRDNVEAVIARLGRMKNSEEDYYKVRASKPRSDTARAARFLYLTRLSFNGIYRVNRNGQFNVPYGQKKHLTSCDPEMIRIAAQSLSNARLAVSDFEETARQARRGDTIYFDPPYTVAHGNNGFLKYNEKILQWEDQVRLANLATEMASRGCRVIVSNADHSSLLELYKDFNLKRIVRSSIIAASKEFRRSISECVFYK